MFRMIVITTQVANRIWVDKERVIQSQQSKIEQLEKELAQMKHINDEQNKNLETAFKTIHIQQKFDADSQGTIACLTEMNGRLENENKKLDDFFCSALKRWKEVDEEKAHLAEMNKRYLGKMQEQQDQIAELKKDLCTHKIEHFEMYGRINYAHHCFLTMDRDQFLKNIEAIICGRLRHPEFSFDKTRIKTLRGEHWLA